MTDQEKKPAARSENATNKDFVIRDGFPALLRPDGSPWIDGDEPLPARPFSVLDRVVNFHQVDDWRQDCETVFSARAKEADAAYSAGATYFWPSGMKPRCGLEGLVASIFHQHITQQQDKTLYRPEQSGAEWWTLVLDNDEDDNDKKKKTDASDESDDDEEDDDEVGTHFDADYGLEDQVPNLLLHPRLATVTYLSDCGAPTVIFHRRSPPPHDLDQLGGDIDTAWLSHPVVGRHVAFDGRLLHGAPATFFPPRAPSDDGAEPPLKKAKTTAESTNSKRYTLLVNIWLNHCPIDAEPLDEEVVSQLKVPWSEKDSPFSWDKIDETSLPKVKLLPDSDDPAGEEETVICSRRVSIVYRPTMEQLHDAAKSHSLMELELDKGAVSVVMGEVVSEEDDEAEGEGKSPS